MGDDEGRVGLVVVDELREASVVGLDVALAGAHLLALKPELAHVEGVLALLFEGSPALGVLGQEPEGRFSSR